MFPPQKHVNIVMPNYSSLRGCAAKRMDLRLKRCQSFDRLFHSAESWRGVLVTSLASKHAFFLCPSGCSWAERDPGSHKMDLFGSAHVVLLLMPSFSFCLSGAETFNRPCAALPSYRHNLLARLGNCMGFSHLFVLPSWTNDCAVATESVGVTCEWCCYSQCSFIHFDLVRH